MLSSHFIIGLPCDRFQDISPHISSLPIRTVWTAHSNFTAQTIIEDCLPYTLVPSSQQTPIQGLSDIRYRRWEVFSSPPHQDRLWGPLSLLSSGYRRFLSQVYRAWRAWSWPLTFI